MKVDIYYNLHRKKLSVRSREKGSYGKVIKHTDRILLKDCKFVVSEPGRQRVLKNKRKNVHAVVRGETIGDPIFFLLEVLDEAVPVTYNPYRYETFVRVEDQLPIYEGDFVLIDGKNITAFGKTGV
jgi:hypothetical protein